MLYAWTSINRTTFGLNQDHPQNSNRYSKVPPQRDHFINCHDPGVIRNVFFFFFFLSNKNAGIDNARPSKRRTNYRIFLPLSREDRAINDGPWPILRMRYCVDFHFSPWAGHLRRSLSALEEPTHFDEGYAVWKTRFVPCRGHCSLWTRRIFQNRPGRSSPFVTLVFHSIAGEIVRGNSVESSISILLRSFATSYTIHIVTKKKNIPSNFSSDLLYK